MQLSTPVMGVRFKSITLAPSQIPAPPKKLLACCCQPDKTGTSFAQTEALKAGRLQWHRKLESRQTPMYPTFAYTVRQTAPHVHLAAQSNCWLISIFELEIITGFEIKQNALLVPLFDSNRISRNLTSRFEATRNKNVARPFPINPIWRFRLCSKLCLNLIACARSQCTVLKQRRTTVADFNLENWQVKSCWHRRRRTSFVDFNLNFNVANWHCRTVA